MPNSPLRLLPILATLSLFTSQGAAQEAVTTDAAVIKILRNHGLEKSQVMDVLSTICDVHGPRLTGSPNLRNAQKWAVEQLKAWGLTNAHLEAWGPFGRGWRLEQFSARIVGQNPWPVHAYPKAWSPSLPTGFEAEVVSVAGKSREEVEAMDLTGKIVLLETAREVSEPFEAEAKRHDSDALLALATGARAGGAPRGGERRGRNFMRQGSLFRVVAPKKPAALLDRSFKGDYGTIFVSGAQVENSSEPGSLRVRASDKGAEVIPQLTLAVEHYNRLLRLLEKNVPVKMAVDLKTTYFEDDLMEYNVVADIPGTDPMLKDEVVMVGAHFDSWHTGTGATDNGCGSAVMMESIRLLTELIKESGQGPRRTIRIALWSGEEQGIMGSRAYVTEHFAESGGRGLPPKSLKKEHGLLAGYYNLDNGTGRIRGVYLQGNEQVAPIFREWLTPFHDLDATTISLGNTGGTDHLSFDAVGLPGFQFIQDPVAYSARTHHSNMDNWDHAVASDLKQAATIVASFAWNTSQRAEKLPRKPLPAPEDSNRKESGQR